MMRLLGVIAAVLVISIGGAAPAMGRTDAPARFGSPVYLALGDSIPAGVGAQPHVTGYPEQLGALLGHGYNPSANKATPHTDVDFETNNIAVGGVTTVTIAPQVTDALGTIGERRRDRDPFNDIEVITVTIGGNDIFTPAVHACILTTTPTGCQPTVDAILATVRANLTSILGQLTGAAGRGTEVAITTYYNPIGSCFLAALNPAAPAIADVVLEGGEITGLLALRDGLNDVIRQAAAATGAQVADLYGQLAPSQLVGGSDCLHPNLAGHTRIAEIVYDTLAR